MSGRPIPQPLRARFERAFGVQFADVRLHDDADGGEQAERAQARAFTVGSDIVWGRSAAAVSTKAGEYTLAHELAHVVQQRRGGSAPGTVTAEHDADAAAVSAAAGAPTAVSGGTAVGMARQAKAQPAVQVQMLREFTDVDGTKKRVTEQEYQQLQEKARRGLEFKLNMLIDSAKYGRKIQSDTLDEYHGKVESLSDLARNPKAIFGIVSDMNAGVTPPYIGMWAFPVQYAERGKEALASGNLAQAARMLQTGASSLRDAEREWSTYREATISGAQTTIGQLEVVRDVSFAIAISAAVVVAAPVAAGVAAGGTAALGLTGTGAAIATGVGTATLTGVAGGTFGFALGSSSEAVAQVANTGKVDTNQVLASGVKWGKEGIVQGVTGGLAKYGTGALKIGKAGAPILKELAKRGAVEAGSNFVGQTTAGILEDNPNKTVGSVLTRGLTGAGTSLLAAPLGMAGDKIAAAKPLLGSKGLTQIAAKGVGVVGASGLGALGAWVSGGDRSQILSGASTAGVSALAMSGAKGPAWAEKLGSSLEAKGKAIGQQRADAKGGPSSTPSTPVVEAAAVKQTPAVDEAPAVKKQAQPVQDAAAAVKDTPAADVAAAAPTVDARIQRARDRLANAQAEQVRAAARGDASGVKVAKAKERAAGADAVVESARQRAQETAAARDAAKVAKDAALPGAKREAGKAYTAAKNAADDAAAKFERAKVRSASANAEAERTAKVAQWRDKIAAKGAAKSDKAAARLGEIEKAVAEGDVPRLEPGEPYSREKWRPNFGKDGPRAKTSRGKAGELEPGAQVRIFKDPLRTPEQLARQQEALKLAKTNPQQAGNEYAQVVGKAEGWGDISESFRQKHGRIGRRWDFGSTKEITIEGRSGRLGDGKLDQLWFDLNERGVVDLTVPSLSPEAESQLARLAGEWQKLTGRSPLILVRETAP
jgi:hypothetical protein